QLEQASAVGMGQSVEARQVGRVVVVELPVATVVCQGGLVAQVFDQRARAVVAPAAIPNAIGLTLERQPHMPVIGQPCREAGTEGVAVLAHKCPQRIAVWDADLSHAATCSPLRASRCWMPSSAFTAVMNSRCSCAASSSGA